MGKLQGRHSFGSVLVCAVKVRTAVVRRVFFFGGGVSDVKHFYLLPAGWPLAGEQGGFVI